MFDKILIKKGGSYVMMLWECGVIKFLKKFEKL